MNSREKTSCSRHFWLRGLRTEVNQTVNPPYRSLSSLTNVHGRLHAHAVHDEVCRVNEAAAQEETDGCGDEGVLAAGAVRAGLLGHLDGGLEKGPVRGGQHHAGRESEADVENDSLEEGTG